MRHFAYFFRRDGAIVVAGGSICTAFPEFAAQFFDVVCAGGVECAGAVIADYLKGSLEKTPHLPIKQIGQYTVDYGLSEERHQPKCDLLESSRGCSFRCSFCSIRAKSALMRATTSRRWPASRRSPQGRAAMVLPALVSHRIDAGQQFLRQSETYASCCRVDSIAPKDPRMAALVTQNIISDRELILKLAASKCFGLFVGLESLDRAMLQRFNKTQNLSRRQHVVGDIAFAESCGIAISYGYLFDPCHQTGAQSTAAPLNCRTRSCQCLPT